jgi:uncharacterized membrane protein
MSETTPQSDVPAAPPGMTRRARRGADRKMEAVKARYASDRSWLERLADAMTQMAGGSAFLVGHVIAFTGWILLNIGLRGLPPFDPFPFGFLTMIVSLEAIVLSIFILMSQNRESAISELRAEVTLEINFCVEEEVTKALQLITGLYSRLNVPLADDPELREMLQPLDKERIEREIAGQIQKPRSAAPKGTQGAR